MTSAPTIGKTAGSGRANGNRTKLRILDAAEQLFGALNFDAVSLRDITDAAGVTLALASYHFGTKDALFEAVIARRAALLCAERETRLDALDAPDVRALADAFMAPLFARTGQDGWPGYFRIVARLGESDRWLTHLAHYFDPTAKRFIAAFRTALPQAGPGTVERAFTMMLQTMLATASQNNRVAQLTGGAVQAADTQAAYAVLLDFVTAGMAAVGDQPSSGP